MTSIRLKELFSLIKSPDVIRRELRDSSSVLRVHFTPIHWIDVTFHNYSDDLIFNKIEIHMAPGIGMYPTTETWLSKENLKGSEGKDLIAFFTEQRDEILKIRSLHYKLEQDKKVNVALIYNFKDRVKEYKCNQMKG